MANNKSAEKRWRQSLKRRLRNRFVRSTARTFIKTANRGIAAGEPDEASLKQAVRALDKAAEKGIIHPNNAARRKSRLMHRFAQALTAPAAPAATTTRRRTAARASTAAATPAPSRAAPRTPRPRRTAS